MIPTLDRSSCLVSMPTTMAIAIAIPADTTTIGSMAGTILATAIATAPTAGTMVTATGVSR